MNLDPIHFWSADVIMPHKAWYEPETHEKLYNGQEDYWNYPLLLLLIFWCYNTVAIAVQSML